jgi:serine protease Do
MKTLLKRMLLTALAFVVAAPASPQPGEDPNELQRLVAATEPGDKVSALSPEKRKALGVDYRLLGLREDPAAASGIRPGDVIVAVGHDEFKSLEEFEKLLAQRKKRERVPLSVRRGEGARYVPVELA